MLKKNLLLLLVLVLLPMSISAGQGAYQRQSVTGVDAIWVSPQASGLLRSWAFDSERFDMFLKYFIEMPRFDFNEIPKNIKRNFIYEANRLQEVNSYRLSEILQSTVLDEILSILSDPEIQRLRSEEFRDESSSQSFAATKAKSFGLTEEELLGLFNSAYIYLPFISSAELTIDKNGNKDITVEGGILWWKITVDKQGRTSISEVLSADTWAMGFVDEERLIDVFVFGNESWQASPIEYAANDVMLAFAKNLSVKTRQLDDFKLSAQITESKGSVHGFPLGLREGVHLDDGFYLVSYEEDDDGTIQTVRKGFARVSKTGDNIEDPTVLSYAKQIFGARARVGEVVIENPRLGINLDVNVGYTTGSNITQDHTFDAISADANSQLSINTIFSYNIAPIINISQMFINLDIGLGIPLVMPNFTSLLFRLSPYLGVTKGFGGRLFLKGSLSLGLDSLINSYENSSYQDVSIINYALGIQAVVEAGYMITPDLKVSGVLGYKLGFPPYESIIKLDGIEYNISYDVDDMRLGGSTVGIGISYSLGSLPFNLFGFLDPLKNY
jgi:hypothetical protein